MNELKINKLFYFKRFLLFFSLPLLLTLGIIVYIYQTEFKADLKILQTEEQLRIEQNKKIILSLFETYYSDIFFLTEIYNIYPDFATGSKAESEKICQSLLAFLRQNKVYDQLRFIDASGYEKFRLNYNNGYPSAVHPDSLQQKSDRYYFIETMKLNTGQVYASPMDLNIDYGVVEDKPMIRFAMPVFSKTGARQGIIILNYFAQTILDIISQHSSAVQGELMLVNRMGFWLHSQNHEDEWGWMFRDRKDRRFQSDYPEEWLDISSRESGIIESSNGLFSFTKVRPLTDSLEMKNRCPSCDNLCWIMISQITPEQLSSGKKALLYRLTLLFTAIGIVLAISAFILTNFEVKKKRAELALKKAALKDPLTDLSNRRDFSERFYNEVARFNRNERGLSLIISDIDHFKLFNDTHGHDCGDAILVQIAGIFKSSLRSQDISCRWGGEEFVIALPETKHENAVLTAEKLRETIESAVFVYKNRNLKVTMSFGVSSYRKGQSLEDCIKSADKGLYEAKNSGRNRVIFNTEES